MKGIEINGKIVTYKVLPKTWGDILNFKSATDSELSALGFKDVITPTITEYQRLGVLFLDVNDTYTYTIIDFTQEEIDDYNQGVLDNDASSNVETNYKVDGIKAYMQLKSKLRRAKDTGVITETQFNLIYRPVREALVWLNTGDWDIAQYNIDNITPPSNPELLNIYNKIKLKLDTYVDNNF